MSPPCRCGVRPSWYLSSHRLADAVGPILCPNNTPSAGDNAAAFVDDFLHYVERYANSTRGDQVMFLMGCDYQVMFLMGCDYQWEHGNECQFGRDPRQRHHCRPSTREVAALTECAALVCACCLYTIRAKCRRV